MSETPLPLAAVAVALLVPLVFVVWLWRSMSRSSEKARGLVEQITPSRVLAEAPVVPGEPVTLRAVAVEGAIKVWLEIDGSPGGGWTGVAHATLATHPGDASYREGPGQTAPTEVRVTFGEGSDGMTSEANVERRGALGIPRGSAYWAQLAPFPAAPPGSELVATVRVEPPPVGGLRFRAFVGVSAR